MVAPGQPAGPDLGPNWWGVAFWVAAILVIVPLRGWYNLRLPEPPLLGQEIVKELLVWIGFVPLIFGFLLVFQGAGWLTLHGPASPNFWWAVWVSAAGFLMIVPLRAFALREEFKGTLRIMIPRMVDLDEDQRHLMMGRRLQVMAAMPAGERKENMKLMMRVIHQLPKGPRAELVRTRTRLVADSPDAQRATLMQTMAMAFSEMGGPERAAMMAEVMGSVAELPEEGRRLMMREMSRLIAM